MITIIIYEYYTLLTLGQGILEKKIKTSMMYNTHLRFET